MSVAKLSLAAAEANAATGKASISKKEESLRSYGPYSVRRCDIYVVSFAPNLVELRLSVVRDLWRAGMRADLVSAILP
jgi:translation initiation factor 2-alpha kinase 4